MNLSIPRTVGTKTAAFIYRPQDPMYYGAICPCCQKRFGSKNQFGNIDIVRCQSCPPFFHKEKELKDSLATKRRRAKTNG